MQKNTIKILTLNSELILSRGTFERADELVKYIVDNDYDVVALQEAFDYEIKDRLTSHFHRHGYGYIVNRAGIPALKGLGFDTGLILVSRFPITKADTMEYNMGSGADHVLARKGFLVADIQIKDKMITYVDTHLQSGHTTGNDNDRKVQLKQLFDYVHAKEKCDGLIMSGDFNLDINNPNNNKYFMSITQKLHLNDLYRSLNPNDAGLTWDSTKNKNIYAPDVEQVRIDGMFVSDELLEKATSSTVDPVLIDGHNFSDHYGVTMEINLS